ncbi:MAG: hypothetical protein HS102_12160 [Planctomycetia bacterium]|nr:hypothetical protein [Planctomycetia bacterium]
MPCAVEAALMFCLDDDRAFAEATGMFCLDDSRAFAEATVKEDGRGKTHFSASSSDPPHFPGLHHLPRPVSSHPQGMQRPGGGDV